MVARPQKSTLCLAAKSYTEGTMTLMDIADALPRTEYHESLNIVEELPTEPISEGHYSFLRLNRKEVTELNHGLHKYPAKFIPQLPRWALSYASSRRREVVLDPFCGSGTT